MPFPLADALEDAANPAPGVDAPDDNPEETQGGKSQAVTYGPDNRYLPKELQDAGLALLYEAQRQDLYQRRIEVLRARRSRFYERGIQHVYEDMNGFFVQGSPGASVPNPANHAEELQCGQYLNNYNIYGRALWIIVAKLTENPVGVDFEPDSGDESKDLQASAAAEGYRINFDRRNDPKDVLTAIVRNMGNDGRTVTWTRTEADVQRWGVDEQGQPRRVQTADIFGVIETKVPIMAKTIGDCPYLIITDDPHVFSAKMQYPYFREDIKTYGESGTGDTEFERIARIGVLQGTGASYQVTDTYKYYCERKRPWFRPSMFESDELDGNFGASGTLRDAFKAAFPDGAMFTFIGEQYVGSRNACFDDELAIDFPMPGDGMSRAGYMDPAIPIQDDFNDDMNNYHEVRVVGWPSTWVRATTAELAAINDQIAAPYCFRALPSKPSGEMEMEDHFYREPDPGIPASFMEATEWMATYLLQFLLAIPSAVQGAGMKDQKTASGYQAALIQAMGQLGLIWGAVQRLMARVYQQAALAASREPQDGKPLVIPSKKGTPIVVNMADLGKGHFLCHASTDAGYPEGTMAKRGTLSQILQLAMQDPAIAQQLLQSPDNWDFVFRTYGIPELVIPEARVRRKQLAEIELLLKAEPVPSSPEELEAAQVQHASAVMMSKAQGQPPPPPFDPMSLLHSSIQPDPLDYHPWELEECREFLSDWPKVQEQMAMRPCALCEGEGSDDTGQTCPACHGEGETNNAAGIQNVRIHANEHLKFIQEMAAQQAAMQKAAAQPAPIKPKSGAPEPQQQQEAA